jgi:predicted DsbA family dithiol-disulfide isomerase
MLVRELSREAPRHTGIAEIVDDLAEDVPPCGHEIPGRCSRYACRDYRAPAPRASSCRGHNATAVEEHMTGSPARPLTIDVVSDVVCPWCFIGKRRLEAALALFASQGPSGEVSVRWHPFELNPELPSAGVDRRRYLEAKFGGPDRAAQIYERVRVAGETVGIRFALDRIARQPNTRDAHRLVAWAQARGDVGPLVERLFAAYFLEGRDPGDRGVLTALAEEAGQDAAAARAMLDSNEGRDAIEASERRAGEIGIGGVPFFIFNGRIAVSGAQEPRVLADAIAESAKTAAA